jgi:hypothetical protein
MRKSLDYINEKLIFSRMKFAIYWILFGVPLATAIFATLGLRWNWSTEHHRYIKMLAILFAVSASLLACIATAYVQFVRPLPAFNYSVEALGLLVSLVGTIMGLISLKFPRWFSSLALAVSAWMLVWFFLLGSTY